MSNANLSNTSYNQAVRLLHQGFAKEAHEEFRKLYAHNKKNPEFLIQMAICSLQLEQYDRVRKLSYDIIKIRPDAGSAHNLLGVVAIKANDYEVAIQHFENYVQYAPSSCDALVNLAYCLNAINRAGEAVEVLKKACALAPEIPRYHYLLAVTYRSLSQKSDAIRHLRQAIELNPVYAGAWKLLAELGELESGHDAERLSHVLLKIGNKTEEQAKIHFAFYSMFEREDNHGQAFEHLAKGNDLIRSTFDEYDVQSDECYMQDIASVFQPQLIDKLAKWGNPSSRPIFILGMPRSGTTLVEHILAGSPAVYAGGELNYFSTSLERQSTNSKNSFPQSASKWTRKSIDTISNSYLKSVSVLNDTAAFVTDKNPFNFMNIGAIRIAFPNAKIIHCQRDPIDTCLGNYRQLFNGAHHYAYNQDELVRYFKAYQTLMKHWQDCFGDWILNVSYEDLVRDSSPEAERIYAFCGLEWDEEFIQLADTSRPIYTSSALQIDEGIHSQYIQRWRKYEPYIPQLIEGLS